MNEPGSNQKPPPPRSAVQKVVDGYINTVLVSCALMFLYIVLCIAAVSLAIACGASVPL